MDQKIEIINNWNLSKFFKEMESGTIKIPRFQRAYVWEKSKIIKLLNSIYNQYPIGSFFLWYAPKEYKNYIREAHDLGLPEDTDANYYQFILDGQQRITSLFVTLKGKMYEGVDYRQIFFDVENKEFIIPKSKATKNQIPVWKLIDTIAYGEVLADYAIIDRKKNSGMASTWRECHEIFTNYPLSIVRTINNDLDDVVEIFERINQGGKRLTTYDLVQATTWGTDFDLNEYIVDFNKRPDVVQYGEINVKVFTTSLTINEFSAFNNTLLLQLSAENCKKIWKKTETAIAASLSFIKEMGIKEDYSPYHNLLPVLQYYFFKTGLKKAKDVHLKELENWFWDAKFSNKYSGSGTPNAKDDIVKFDQLTAKK